MAPRTTARPGARRRLLAAALAGAAVALGPPGALALAPFTCPAADTPGPLPCYVGWQGSYFQISNVAFGAPVAAVTSAEGGLCARAHFRCTADVAILTRQLNALGFYAPPVTPCTPGQNMAIYMKRNLTDCQSRRAWLAATALPPPAVTDPLNITQQAAALDYDAQVTIADAMLDWTYCDHPLCNFPDGGYADSGARRAVPSVLAVAPLLLAAAAAALA
jgi:hypothetical protein